MILIEAPQPAGGGPATILRTQVDSNYSPARWGHRPNTYQFPVGLGWELGIKAGWDAQPAIQILQKLSRKFATRGRTSC